MVEISLRARFEIARPLPGQVWSLKSRKEANNPGAPEPLAVGNFSAATLFADPLMKTGGQGCWLKLGSKEIEWIKSLNTNPEYLNWSGACKPVNGGMYKTFGGIDPKQATEIYWFRIASHSPDGGPRNQVLVLKSNDRCCQIASIPKSADYSPYSNNALLVPNMYTIYPDMHTGTMVIYRMPLWNPATFPGNPPAERELWLPNSWLYQRVA